MSREEIVAELADLWQAATVHLPTVATDYDEAATEVRYATNLEFVAFSGLELHFTQDLWADISDAFKRLLEDSADELRECGRALESVVTHYAEEDGVSAEVMIAVGNQVAEPG